LYGAIPEYLKVEYYDVGKGGNMEKEFSALCEVCKEWTTHIVIEQRPVDIPPDEVYIKSKCSKCGEIFEETCLEYSPNERG
jgi:formylmethanofuran dehydrogenase subunit E